jgi:two-component system osmolarity sensor histidine kinase EnvZ
MKPSGSVAALKDDVGEMERMLEGYLEFARGEGAETPEPHDVVALLDEAVRKARRINDGVELKAAGSIVVPLRPNAFRRCLNNLIGNATRYARHVVVDAGRRGRSIEIIIDDDGPGIPEARRDDVFKPFFRMEGSRNPGTGGVGLGMTIARDVARGHGGEIVLGDSPMGGLRVRLRLPL